MNTILIGLLSWTLIVAAPFACLYFKRHRELANHLHPLPPGSILDKRQTGEI